MLCSPSLSARSIVDILSFVLYKFLGVPKDSPLLYQPNLMSHELSYIFANAPDPTGNVAFASDAVRRAAGIGGSASSAADTADAAAAAIAAAIAAGKDVRQVDPTADCPICYDELGSVGAKLTYCSIGSGGCGNSLHAACMSQWVAAKSKSGLEVPCPFCRELSCPFIAHSDYIHRV